MDLASFAIIGSRVFTAGDDGADHDTLWCLDLDSGAVLWQHTLSVPTKYHDMSIVPLRPRRSA